MKKKFPSPDKRSIRRKKKALLSTTVEVVRYNRDDFENNYSNGEDIYGLYIKDVLQTPLLSKEKERSLFMTIKRGGHEAEQAREDMIKANLLLVIKIAMDYLGFGLPLLDLVSEGNIGLMKAVERFRLNKGAKFSTYAALWIKQRIKKALANQSRTIRIPVHMLTEIRKLNRVEVKLRTILDRDPTLDEIAQELGISVARVVFRRAAIIKTVYLDAPIGKDADSCVMELLIDKDSINSSENMEREERFEMIHKMVDSLSDREATIIKERFALNGSSREKTLEEVSWNFGVTRERIRQIQEKAFKKLRRMIEKRENIDA